MQVHINGLYLNIFDYFREYQQILSESKNLLIFLFIELIIKFKHNIHITHKRNI